MSSRLLVQGLVVAVALVVASCGPSDDEIALDEELHDQIGTEIEEIGLPEGFELLRIVDDSASISRDPKQKNSDGQYNVLFAPPEGMSQAEALDAWDQHLLEAGLDSVSQDGGLGGCSDGLAHIDFMDGNRKVYVRLDWRPLDLRSSLYREWDNRLQVVYGWRDGAVVPEGSMSQRTGTPDCSNAPRSYFVD